MCVWIPSLRFQAAFCSFFFFFFFFFSRVLGYCSYCSMNSNRKYWLSAVNSVHMHCLRIHKFHFLSIFLIKNGSHITNHTFKNYFATVFSVFSFQFQQNKFYPNTPIRLCSHFSLVYPSPNFCSNLSPHFPITEVTLVPVAKTRFWQVEFPKVFSWTLSLLGI